jgi:glutamyl-tRNA reductase
MAIDRLGTLAGKRVLVVGAGDMGEGIAAALVQAGATDISVTNRTLERAAQLAKRVSGRVVPFGKLPTAISRADVLLTCTGSGGVLVDVDTMVAGRLGVADPLLVVDIAVPRDVAPDVNELPDVTLLNLDHLRDWADRGLAQRAGETDRVRAIVAEDIEHYLVESTARQAAPLVAQLHEQAEAVRTGELDRFANRLAGFDDAQLATVDAVTRGIVAKLLHQLSVKLKADAGTPQGERNAAAVRDLFDLT